MAKTGNDIVHAKDLLNAGKLVAIPTETVYGLAGNALDPSVISQIYSVKGRPSTNPLILHIGDANQVLDYATNFPEAAQKLTTAFWPGPLTVVLPKKPHIPDATTGGLDTVALRIPDHPLTRDLLQQLDFPLAAPSANLSNRVSPVMAEHVDDQLGEKIPYILDGGQCNKGIESTIISFAGENPRILRRGTISQEDIEAIIGPVEMAEPGEKLAAPGMLSKHYAPKTPLILVDKWQDINGEYEGKKIGLLCLSSDAEAYGHFSVIHQLSPIGDLEQAAYNFYACLVDFDYQLLDLIIAERMPNKGLGITLNDKLERASS